MNISNTIIGSNEWMDGSTMEQGNKKILRSTQMQIQLLQKYMANNKTIANGDGNRYSLSPFEVNRRAKEWIALRALLRKHGPDKSVEKWKLTWRDLKRKFKKQKLAQLNGIKAKSHSNDVHIEENCDTAVSNSDILLESSTKYADPLETYVVCTSLEDIKDESSMPPVEIEQPSVVILDTPCSSPMQVVLTNTEVVTSTATSSTQTYSKPSVCAHSSKPPSVCAHSSKPPSVCARSSKPPSVCADSSKPPSVCAHSSNTPSVCAHSSKTPSVCAHSSKPPSVCAHSSKPLSVCAHSSKPPCICAHSSNPPCICAYSSKPPCICAHENSLSSTTHSYSQCCHQNESQETVLGTINSQYQQNALLQKLCNLLEEQNSNLRIRNRIERNKMRSQFCRRF